MDVSRLINKRSVVESCLSVYSNHGKRRRRERKSKKKQRGGASIRKVNQWLRKGPSLTDKIPYTASMPLSGPAPGFGKLGTLLEKQALKGIVDNVNHYKKRRR